MRASQREVVVMVVFQLLLCALVESGLEIMDRWILILAWIGFAIISFILMIKNASEAARFYFGELLFSFPAPPRKRVLAEESRGKESFAVPVKSKNTVIFTHRFCQPAGGQKVVAL